MATNDGLRTLKRQMGIGTYIDIQITILVQLWIQTEIDIEGNWICGYGVKESNPNLERGTKLREICFHDSGG